MTSETSEIQALLKGKLEGREDGGREGKKESQGEKKGERKAKWGGEGGIQQVPIFSPYLSVSSSKLDWGKRKKKKTELMES